MRSKKTYIILIVFFVIFFLIMFLVFGVGNILQENYQATIIVGDNTVWHLQNKTWRNINVKTEKDYLSWKKYEVFINNEKIGNYNLWYDDSWYAFDDNNEAIDLDGVLLAYEANFDLGVRGFIEEEAMNIDAVQSVLMNHGIDPTSELTEATQISIDYDQDGVVEDFFAISNAFSLDFAPDVIFSYIFMVKNDEITMIYEEEGASMYNACKPYFTSFLDVNHDNTSELIVGCGRYSVSEPIDMLYQYDNGIFKMLISNQ